MADPLSIFRQWIEQVTSLKVIYADDPEPAAPRPNADPTVLSYAAIDIQEDKSAYGTTFERTTNEGAHGKKYRSTVRAGLLAVEFYGPGAADYARSLTLMKGAQATRDLLATWGDVAMGAIGSMSDEPVLRSASREPDASMTIEIRWTDSTVTTLTDSVDAAELTSTVEMEVLS